MAYRIADHKLYDAGGMEGHPGVPFYFISWLALAIAGYPVASAGSGFFSRVIEHVEDFHQITVWLNALAGALGVYLFARLARNLVPVGVVVIGLLVWLLSTPATLLAFLSPSIDAFAIAINSLFFAILLRLASERDVSLSTAGLSGCVGALAYLNKLSYVYIPLTLAGIGILNLAFRRSGWIRGSLLSIVFVLILFGVIIATGYFIVGWNGFQNLLRFHQSVILGTGLYGAGTQDFASRDEIWRALAAVPGDGTYAVLIALIGGASLVVSGLVAGLKRPQNVPVAIFSVGSGTASVLSALFVIKHYAPHYTAGVSATLPACIVSGYLLTKSWDYRPRVAAAAIVAVATLFMASQTRGHVTYVLATRSETSRLAKIDLEEINAYLAANKRTVEFAYKAPFSWFGEGFALLHANIPRLNDEYVQSHQEMYSSMTAKLVNEQANKKPGAYVIDKGYFPTVESVKNASNVALIGPEPVTLKEGDKLIEFRTVFLLIPG